MRILGDTVEHPFFMDDVFKIFYMVDVPQDKKMKFRLAPKMTDDHLFPNNFKKMKVILASQVPQL